MVLFSMQCILGISAFVSHGEHSWQTNKVSMDARPLSPGEQPNKANLISSGEAHNLFAKQLWSESKNETI